MADEETTVPDRDASATCVPSHDVIACDVGSLPPAPQPPPLVFWVDDSFGKDEGCHNRAFGSMLKQMCDAQLEYFECSVDILARLEEITEEEAPRVRVITNRVREGDGGVLAGHDLVGRVRALEREQLANVPIVVFCGAGHEDEAETGLECAGNVWSTSTCEEVMEVVKTGSLVRMKERVRGSMLGLASCDALGTTLEFSARDTFTPISGIVGGGPFNLRAGEWTDDTSMALCIAESLSKRRKFDAHDIVERFVLWWKEGHLSSNGRCFDIGGCTRTALDDYYRDSTGKRTAYCGSTDPRSAGNGSLMRLCPIPLAYERHPRAAIELAGQSSCITHSAEMCIDSCKYFAGLILGALRGAPKQLLLSEMYCPVDGYWNDHPLCPEVQEVARGSFKRKTRDEIEGSGFVIRSMEAALWAFWSTDTFKEGALMAVNLGDDADTTGAVYGQLAGAYYGVESIPIEWRRLIARRDVIDFLSNELLAVQREVSECDFRAPAHGRSRRRLENVCVICFPSQDVTIGTVMLLGSGVVAERSVLFVHR